MRKLLLATAAIMGATGGLAMAQSAPNPIQGSYAGPMGAYSPGYSTLGSISTYESGSPSLGAGSMTGVKPPAMQPGTVKIHLNGRLEMDFGVATTSLNTYNAGGVGNIRKTNPVGLSSYLRLYPGIDGLAANGLRYGGAAEIRTNFAGNLGTTISPTASGNSSAQTMYLRRDFVYLASDQVGLLRIGQADGVIGLLDGGTFSSQLWDAGTGNFNGGAGYSMMNANVGGIGGDWPWLTWAGQEYDSNKLVYISPQFYGFDFGIDYSPNNGNSYSSNFSCNVAAATACIGASNSGNIADNRWMNRVSVGGRFQHAFDMVDVKLLGYYTTAGKVSNAVTATEDTIGLYDFAAAVTAFNTTLAVDYSGGPNNAGLFMKPKGAPNANALLIGATYRNGPLTLGAEFETIDNAGNATAATLKTMGQQHEYGVTFGANYALAPGLNLTAEYIYAHRHQGGWDYAAKSTGTANNDVQGQAFTVSTVVSW